MIVDNFHFMLDSCSKFFKSLYIRGWFHVENKKLERVTCLDSRLKPLVQVSSVGEFHGGVSQLGPDKGFSIQILNEKEEAFDDKYLLFEVSDTKKIKIKVQELIDERLYNFNTPKLLQKFLFEIKKSKNRPAILDVGGRARSGLDRSKMFPFSDVTVLDIIHDSNVNVVGDAHELTKYFPKERFDGLYCVSVFEHLLMPWKVVLEMNRVLKIGGIALIHTHQTLGMHDLPWDFWRFSDTSWDSLFNAKTGFKIIERAMDSEQYVIPFLFRPEKINAEKSAGFEGSSVLVKKIGSTNLSWDVLLSEIISTSYPCNDDGQKGETYVK